MVWFWLFHFPKYFRMNFSLSLNSDLTFLGDRGTYVWIKYREDTAKQEEDIVTRIARLQNLSHRPSVTTKKILLFHKCLFLNMGTQKFLSVSLSKIQMLLIKKLNARKISYVEFEKCFNATLQNDSVEQLLKRKIPMCIDELIMVAMLMNKQITEKKFFSSLFRFLCNPSSRIIRSAPFFLQSSAPLILFFETHVDP